MDGLKSNYADAAAALNAPKRLPECVWLRDVSVGALQASLRHLDNGPTHWSAGG